MVKPDAFVAVVEADQALAAVFVFGEGRTGVVELSEYAGIVVAVAFGAAVALFFDAQAAMVVEELADGGAAGGHLTEMVPDIVDKGTRDTRFCFARLIAVGVECVTDVLAGIEVIRDRGELLTTVVAVG